MVSLAPLLCNLEMRLAAKQAQSSLLLAALILDKVEAYWSVRVPVIAQLRRVDRSLYLLVQATKEGARALQEHQPCM